MNDIIELPIFHNNTLKLIIYEKELLMENFLEDLRKKFNIETSIALMDGEAEITSVKSFYNGRKLQIIQRQVELFEEENENMDLNVLEVPNLDIVVHDNQRISFDEIRNLEFPTSTLLNDLNLWAHNMKFHLVKTEGVKSSKDGYFRSFICNEKKCKFRLTFRSDPKGDIYKLDERLAEKNNYHSKVFVISFKTLDHSLIYQSNGILDENISKEIDKFKAKMTTSNLTDHINKTFNTSFKNEQMRYKVKKLVEEKYGKAEEDAYNFVALAKEEVQNGGAFCFETDAQNLFQRCLFVSAVMLEYSKSFLDLVMVDATYKKNRFGLPLVNIIGLYFFFNH